ncbi:MAG: metallophosphoesterase [Clostridiales bacterium]|nr:metallophosphoesterase [Clostridiales bacterium]
MSLFAIGDLHLHFGSELKAAGQRTGRIWKDHEARFRENCLRVIREDDTLVLVGDHSWGKNEDECRPDFDFIAALPGEKILLRGNHDMFWDAKKTGSLNERFGGRLKFLQNNFFAYRDFALVGTKGFTFEGPFWIDRRGRVAGWDEEAEEHAAKLVDRELERLRISFEAAKAAGFRKYLVFLHYPPTSVIENESGFTRMAEEYCASQVIYAHSHGETRFHDSVEGMKNGVFYRLVSGDYLRWMPEKIMD